MTGPGATQGPKIPQNSQWVQGISTQAKAHAARITQKGVLEGRGISLYKDEPPKMAKARDSLNGFAGKMDDETSFEIGKHPIQLNNHSNESNPTESPYQRIDAISLKTLGNGTTTPVSETSAKEIDPNYGSVADVQRALKSSGNGTTTPVSENASSKEIDPNYGSVADVQRALKSSLKSSKAEATKNVRWADDVVDNEKESNANSVPSTSSTRTSQLNAVEKDENGEEFFEVDDVLISEKPDSNVSAERIASKSRSTTTTTQVDERNVTDSPKASSKKSVNTTKQKVVKFLNKIFKREKNTKQSKIGPNTSVRPMDQLTQNKQLTESSARIKALQEKYAQQTDQSEFDKETITILDDLELIKDQIGHDPESKKFNHIKETIQGFARLQAKKDQIMQLNNGDILTRNPAVRLALQLTGFPMHPEKNDVEPFLNDSLNMLKAQYSAAKENHREIEFFQNAFNTQDGCLEARFGSIQDFAISQESGEIEEGVSKTNTKEQNIGILLNKFTNNQYKKYAELSGDSDWKSHIDEYSMDEYFNNNFLTKKNFMKFLEEEGIYQHQGIESGSNEPSNFTEDDVKSITQTFIDLDMLNDPQ